MLEAALAPSSCPRPPKVEVVRLLSPPSPKGVASHKGGIDGKEGVSYAREGVALASSSLTPKGVSEPQGDQEERGRKIYELIITPTLTNC